jgi:hypothetical protein
MLVLLSLVVDVEVLRGIAGDCMVEERLEMRGILVGVSFVSSEVRGYPPDVEGCELYVPTDGDPAMGGRLCRPLRSDESEALVPGERGVIEETEARLRAVVVGGGMRTESLDSLDLSEATRCAVDEDKAEICMGGNATGFGCLVSVEDRV